MSTRWIHELAIPGNPDLSSIWASYVLAVLHAAFASAALMSDVHVVEFWLFAMLFLGLQLRLLFGVLIAKGRASLPAPTGHAAMFPNPQPLATVGWLRAFGGLGIVAATWILLAASR